MFYDEAKIYIRSGDGGDGAINFRREKFVSLGGPDGGDGGKGGDIIFQVNPKLNSLSYFHRKVHFWAENGTSGKKQNQTGACGEKLVLQVPPGTILRRADTLELIADLTTPYEEVVILHGGQAGRGNGRFASSTNQAPRFAEKGVPGSEMWLTMELKLIADVGLVGKPNAGKSTFLAAISSARPKIANYPFTTLHPNLGVVMLDNFESLVVADIPGLIEGAADGIGLGHDFLRHIERTRVLIHLLDGSAENPIEDWETINNELALYDVQLERKPQIVVLNKLDLEDAVAWEPIIEEIVVGKGYSFMAISAVTGQGVRSLLYRVKQMIDTLPAETVAVEDDIVVIRPKSDPNQFYIEQVAEEEWSVHGENIEKIAAQTYFDVPSAARRFQRILDKMGVTAGLEKAGVLTGHTVHIGQLTLEWQDEDDYSW